jgi:hypothetical protein
MALYDDVLAISREYLGPAADRFLTKQITGKLSLADKGDLTSAHLDELAKWCHTSGSKFLDESQASEYAGMDMAMM